MIDTLQFQKKESNGYIIIKVEEQWIREHIFVMQEFICRELDKDEVVHHCDSNTKNNDIDNLVLFPNQNAHAHFHRQIRQFGMTRPRLIEIKTLKENMENLHNERNN